MKVLPNTSILIQRNLEIPGTVPGLSFIQYRKCTTKNVSFFFILGEEMSERRGGNMVAVFKSWIGEQCIFRNANNSTMKNHGSQFYNSSWIEKLGSSL